MLAAFSGGKCVGVCNNRYYKQNDMYYAMLTVYSNDVSSDNLEFRIWDASTGQTYIAESEKPISFENNAVVGSPSQPVLFTAKDYRVQNITLNEGWTWISTNIASDKLSDLNKLLADGKWTSDRSRRACISQDRLLTPPRTSSPYAEQRQTAQHAGTTSRICLQTTSRSRRLSPATTPRRATS